MIFCTQCTLWPLHTDNFSLLMFHNPSLSKTCRLQSLYQNCCLTPFQRPQKGLISCCYKYFTWSDFCLCKHKDSNHCRTVPLFPMTCSNFCNKIWSPISNAALRSSRTSTEMSPLSAVTRRSFVTSLMQFLYWWTLLFYNYSFKNLEIKGRELPIICMCWCLWLLDFKQSLTENDFHPSIKNYPYVKNVCMFVVYIILSVWK